MPVPDLGPFADPEKNLDYWTRTNNIVGRRMRGESAEEIAEAVGVEVTTVHRAISKAADHQRDAVRATIDEMFMLHQRRLEDLYRKVQDQIDIQIEKGFLDHNMVRAAIAVLERQSRLLDLDRAKRGEKGAASSTKRGDWLEKATDDEVVRIAREDYGINIPEKFELSHSASA